MMKLVALEEGKREELISGSLENLVEYLQSNPSVYEWQLSEDPELEMPVFDEIETIGDLEAQLEKVDLSWWTLAVETE